MKKFLIWKTEILSIIKFQFPRFSTSFVIPPPKHCISSAVHRKVIERHIDKSF